MDDTTLFYVTEAGLLTAEAEVMMICETILLRAGMDVEVAEMRRIICSKREKASYVAQSAGLELPLSAQSLPRDIITSGDENLAAENARLQKEINILRESLAGREADPEEQVEQPADPVEPEGMLHCASCGMPFWPASHLTERCNLCTLAGRRLT